MLAADRWAKFVITNAVVLLIFAVGEWSVSCGHAVRANLFLHLDENAFIALSASTTQGRTCCCFEHLVHALLRLRRTLQITVGVYFLCNLWCSDNRLGCGSLNSFRRFDDNRWMIVNKMKSIGRLLMMISGWLGRVENLEDGFGEVDKEREWQILEWRK